jgi:hypothetical protein
MLKHEKSTGLISKKQTIHMAKGTKNTKTTTKQTMERRRNLKRLSFQPCNSYTVQLDIDNTDDLVLFHKHMLWLSCIMNEAKQPLRGFSESRSRSGKHWHVEIKLSRPLPVMTRIAIASFMGSDRAREMCSFERVMFSSKYPVLFWKKKIKNGGK